MVNTTRVFFRAGIFARRFTEARSFSAPQLQIQDILKVDRRCRRPRTSRSQAEI
jgi:hypothetical protein